MKRKGKTVLVLLLLLIAAGGAGLWWQSTRRRARSVSPWRTAVVIRRDFASTVLATGSVKSQVGSEVRVGARISGRVERLHANVGDVVRKTQVIAELEKADLEAIVAQRQAELRTDNAGLSALKTLYPREVAKNKADEAKWQATVTQARKELERQKNLVRRDFASQQVLDRAQEQLSVAEADLASVHKTLDLIKARQEADVEQARARIARAEALLAHARARLSYATITAPIPGIIASVSTQEGETVAAGLNAPTFVTIIDLNRLQVDAFVDEVDIGRIKIGQRAGFSVDAFPAREFKGKVTAIYPKAIIQENVVNYDVVIEITEPYSGLLRPEMTANVTIFLEARTNVPAVPAKVVKRERGKNVVYAVVNGQAQRREVTVGWRDGTWIEVIHGLKEGETLLLEYPPQQGNREVEP